MTENLEYLLWALTLIGVFPVIIICSTLCAFGVHVAARFNHYEEFDEDPKKGRKTKITGKMILWWIRYYGSYLPEFWRKPLYFCMPCMGSVWSLAYSFMYSILLLPDWWYVVIVWPLAALPTSGINSWLVYNLKTEPDPDK